MMRRARSDPFVDDDEGTRPAARHAEISRHCAQIDSANGGRPIRR